jgi:hypothetical protein
MTGIAALAGALALSLSFALLFAQRISPLLHIGTVQALAAALALGALSWAQHDAALCVAALLALALNGLALPLALRRLIERAATSYSVRWRTDLRIGDGRVCAGGGFGGGHDAGGGRGKFRAAGARHVILLLGLLLPAVARIACCRPRPAIGRTA